MIGYHARPGRQLLLFGWLVGLPAVMVETIFLSIITTQPPLLRLLTWPCPPHLLPVYSLGAYSTSVWIGGASRVVPKCLSDSVWLVCLVPNNVLRRTVWYSCANYSDGLSEWFTSIMCLKVLCRQFAKKAVSCKIWGSHRGGTEDLTASIFGVSWTTQKLETPRSPETSAATNLHIGVYLNNWTFSGFFFLAFSK